MVPLFYRADIALFLNFSGKTSFCSRLESYVSFMCAFAEPYDDENLAFPNSPDISGVERQPSLSDVSGLFDSFLLSTDSLVRENLYFTLYVG